MGRRGSSNRTGLPPTDWESERTLAAAEADVPEPEAAEMPSGDAACLCGNRELLLEAYLRVIDGKVDPEPLEVETLTCPECGREFEAIQVEGGRIARGELVGQTDVDD
jgi:hypothetical protein